MPGYDALNDLMNVLDPHAYAAALTAWLQANNGILPRRLALDGKYVGDGKCGMMVKPWQEDRHRRVNIAQNLALTHNALLAIIPFAEKHNLPSLIAEYQDDKTRAINLILHTKPIP